MKAILKRLIPLIFGTSVIIAIVLFADISWDELLSTLKRTKISIIISILGCTAFIYWLSALRWKIIIEDLTQKKFSLWQLMYFIVLGAMSNFFIFQSVGDLSIRSLALKTRKGTPLPQASFSIFFDQFFTIIASGIFALTGLFFFLKVTSLTLSLILSIALALVVFFILKAFGQKVIQLVINLLARAAKWIKKIPPLKSINTDFKESLSVSQKTITKIYLLSILKYLCLALRPFLVTVALDLDLSFALILFGSAIALSMLLLTFTYGLMGFTELSWYTVLSWASVSKPQAALFILFDRVFFIFSVLCVGSLVLLLYSIIPFIKKPRVADATSE